MIKSTTFTSMESARAFYESNEQATALTVYKGVIKVHFEAKDEAVELVVKSGKVDEKGRSIDYILGTNVVDGVVYGWVQNARDGKDFGTFQRSKQYPSIERANTANKIIASDRISKLK